MFLRLHTPVTLPSPIFISQLARRMCSGGIDSLRTVPKYWLRFTDLTVVRATELQQHPLDATFKFSL
jgi:hypothetical protein